MKARAHASEWLLGELGVQRLDIKKGGRVLVGGLGLGFTLRSVLEAVNAKVRVEVVELLPEIVQWNEDFLQDLHGACLQDARVSVRAEDVYRVIAQAEPASYDVMVLDVDNGPVAMVAAGNAALYDEVGLRLVQRALSARGRVVFWSAGRDEAFAKRLRSVGFRVQAVPAKLHAGAKRAAYVLYVADI